MLACDLLSSKGLALPISPLGPDLLTFVPLPSPSGYICISLPSSRLEELDIPMMVAHNEETNKTAYTVTVDYKIGSSSLRVHVLRPRLLSPGGFRVS